MTIGQQHENRIRKLARRRGYSVHKSRRPVSLNNHDEFRLVDADRNVIVLGEHFDATLQDVEAYLTDVSA